MEWLRGLVVHSHVYSQSLFKSEFIANGLMISFYELVGGLLGSTEATLIPHADTGAPYWSIWKVHTDVRTKLH